MKLLISILIATLTTTSQASTTPIQPNGNERFGKPTHIAVQPKTATRNAPVLVKRISKPKIFTGNPHRNKIFATDYDDEFLEIDDIITSYRRRDLGKIEEQEEAPLPEHIRWRLFLARQLALLKHREIHS